jgi:RND family efflux transporter MFP subunit
LSQLELERAQKLFAGNVISQAELDAQEARAESAQAALKDAIARSGEAGLALDDTVLRAPMDGVVLARQVEIGTLAAAGQPAVTLADIRNVKAVFGAPQVLVEKLEIGEAVQVFVGAEGEDKAPEKLLDARITRIAPAADQSGRVFSVEALLPNPSGELRPGAVVSVRVPERAQSAETLVVPLSSVVRSRRDPHGFSVFVLEGDGDRGPVREARVALGQVVGNAVTVTEGLAAHERIVTVGSTLLRDGGDAVVIR